MPNEISDGHSSTRLALVEEELSYAIVGCFFRVYNQLGYGYLESIYSKAMEVALVQKGLTVQRELPVPVLFDGVVVGRHRLDTIVEQRVILEFKSTERLTEVPKRQIRSYLAACDLELGLLLHFGPRAAYYRILRRRQTESSRSNSAHLENSDG